jgi:hypothetical protein
MSKAELVAQLLERPEFDNIIADIERQYYEEWLSSDGLDERERLFLKVEILQEVVVEIKSLAGI